MFLSKETFQLVIENTPLFSIDLVVINQMAELLVGKRLNPPAKDFWFVPGGRVFKNETLEDAFKRLSIMELGEAYKRHQAKLLGITDHFYSDSIFGDHLSTHYINAAYLIKVKTEELKLPYGEQHNAWRWVKLSEVESDDSIHHYSKVFMPGLLDVMQDE
jgi:colanic acid biosynthesis protein WcaH